MTKFDSLRPVQWRDGALHLVDQRRLPGEEVWLRYDRPEAVAEAIQKMVVRGAPAIGCAAAFAMALSASRAPEDPDAFLFALQEDGRVLAAARPTAVNLTWAVRRMLDRVAVALPQGVSAARSAAHREAAQILEEDVRSCKEMGRLALPFLPDRVRLLTHCNAGALATGGYGTALGVVRAAAEAGRLERVYADETRPRQQGARLTAWELHHEGLPVTVLPDTAAGFLMAAGKINCVVVGADRIARNGDVANKIGTYQVAILAAHHQIPFFVAAPLSTVDSSCPSGAEIPIEHRDPKEVAFVDQCRVVPEGIPCENPAFDVTPASLVKAIFTERGVVEPPFLF